MPGLRLAIMQPTYLPWAGYFNLVASSDIFVFLDDAQFQRGTFDQRNRIFWRGKERWLTVPVRRTGNFQKYCEARIDDSKPWQEEHYRLLESAYEASPHFSDLLPSAQRIRQMRPAVLSEVNTVAIEDFARRMGLGTAFVRSSELAIPGKRTERVVAICRALGAAEYLSSANAREYLESDGFPRDIPIRYQTVELREYPQAASDRFIAKLSIADIVANLGLDDAAAYVRDCARYSR